MPAPAGCRCACLLALSILSVLPIAVAPSARATAVPPEPYDVAPLGTATWDQMRAREAAEPDEPYLVPRMEFPIPPALSGPAVLPSALRCTDLSRATAVAALGDDFVALDDAGTAAPPDTMGAVGPDHLVTMLNSQVRIQTKAGADLGTVSLRAFWGADGRVFDPRIIYDPLDARWIATADMNARQAESAVLLAVSHTADPTQGWDIYQFPADFAGAAWADFPGLGVNAAWIAITNNMYAVGDPMPFVGAKMWVIDKRSALDGGGIRVNLFPAGFDVAAARAGAVLQPAITVGSDVLYLVDSAGYRSRGTTLLRLSQITGSGTAPQWSAVDGSAIAGSGLFPVMSNFDFRQIDAPQLDAAEALDTADARIASLTTFRDGRLWLTHSGAVPAGAADRTAVFWYAIDPAAMPDPIVDAGVLDEGAGIHLLYPSIAVNGAGDVVIGCSRSDAGRYAEAVYTSRQASDPPGTMAPLTVLKEGEAPYRRTHPDGRTRWGDYSATVVDPTDERIFWTVQQYSAIPAGPEPSQSRWGTWWGRIEIGGPFSTPTPEEPTPTMTVEIADATPTPTPPACTGDCNADLAVTVNDLITGVNILLGNQSAEVCPAFADDHGGVTVSQLVRGVTNSLAGCP